MVIAIFDDATFIILEKKKNYEEKKLEMTGDIMHICDNNIGLGNGMRVRSVTFDNITNKSIFILMT